MTIRYFSILIISVFGVQFIGAQSILETPKPLSIAYTPKEILMDGFVNDSAWLRAFENTPNRKFTQFFPYDTSNANTNTRFAFAYNNKYLYAIFICENRNPEKPFVVQGLKRDFSVINNDAVVLTLSPFKDGQNGFSFGVTPYNAQREGSVEGGGGFGVTTAWDQVWFSETHQFDGYWVAEFAIPLQSIRFSPGVDVWGFNVARLDFKNNEVSNFSRVPRTFNVSSLVFCDSFHFKDGRNEKKSLNLVLIPYLSSIASQGFQGSPIAWKNKVSNAPKLGINAKLAVTSSLNLDVTANPDFAQVEVDEQQINLSQYSLFFPERRQFFTENSDLFANFGFRQIRPFFSRRIGMGEGGSVPILGGVRLSGKLGDGLRLGFMNITSQSMEKTDLSKYVPMVNYTVFSVQKKILDASNIAFIWVNDQRLGQSIKRWDVSQGKEIVGPDFNTVVGTECNFLSKTNQWLGKALIQKSIYPGILANNGFAHATFLQYRNNNWLVMWNHEYAAKTFLARSGFVPRTDNYDPKTKQIVKLDYWRLEPILRYTFYPTGSGRINNHSFLAYNSSYYDSIFSINESFTKLGYNVIFQKSPVFHLSLEHNYYRLLFPFDPLGKKYYFLPGKYEWVSFRSGFESNSRKPLNAIVELLIGGYFQGKKIEFNHSLVYRVPRIGRRQLPKLVMSVNWRHININMVDSGSTNINLVALKTEYSLSTIQYISGFLQYNTQTEKMNLNIRFQWRYRPMSDFFLVYSQNYDRFITVSPQQNQYLAASNRSVAIKWVYWIQ